MRARGAALAELLVATALGLGVLTTLTAGVGVGGRLLVAAGARAEAEDTAQLAVEALVWDVRRAGWDPGATGLAALVDARDDGLTLAADLDGDGGVDAASEEVTAWRCALATRRLSRIVGHQSMPLADGVVGCAFRYLDGDGLPLVPPFGVAQLARVRAIVLSLRVLPAGLGRPSARTIVAALRTAP